MTRNKHYISARTAATAATARIAAAVLWNPSGTARIFVYELWVCSTTAGLSNLAVARATARGTASTTVTPGADNSVERDAAAPSGTVLDVAWSVAPTIAAGDLPKWNLPASIGAGIIMPFPDPITVPPGTGLALITPVSVILPASDVSLTFGD